MLFHMMKMNGICTSVALYCKSCMCFSGLQRRVRTWWRIMSRWSRARWPSSAAGWKTTTTLSSSCSTPTDRPSTSETLDVSSTDFSFMFTAENVVICPKPVLFFCRTFRFYSPKWPCNPMQIHNLAPRHNQTHLLSFKRAARHCIVDKVLLNNWVTECNCVRLIRVLWADRLDTSLEIVLKLNGALHAKHIILPFLLNKGLDELLSDGLTRDLNLV